MKTITRYFIPSMLVSLLLFSMPGQAQIGGLKKNYIAAWGGNNAHQQLNIPSDVANAYIVDIAVGHYHGLALLADRMTIKGWGSTMAGETATQNFGKVVIDLSAGEFYSMALLADGSVQFWGNPSRYPTTPYVGAMVEPGAIEAGSLHWLVKMSTNVVYDSLYGSRTFPLPVVAMAAGSNYSLALLADGSVYHWAGAVVTPKLVGVRAEKGAIAAGDDHWIALMNNPTANVVYEESFFLGGFTGFRPPFHKQIKELSAGTRSSLALFRDGTFSGWGDSSNYSPPSSWLNGGWFLNESIPPVWLNKAKVLEVGAGVDFGVAFYTLDRPARVERPIQMDSHPGSN